MTETTPRIRWIDSPETSTTAFIGWAGSIHESQFAIYKPDQDEGDYILVSQLSGLDEKRSYDADPEALKAEAERWLAGFVSSLGAVFPDDATLPKRDARHRLDLTCGACRKEFGTNCHDDDIRCAECGAHRCPHCGGWFGED